MENSSQLIFPSTLHHSLTNSSNLRANAQFSRQRSGRETDSTDVRKLTVSRLLINSRHPLGYIIDHMCYYVSIGLEYPSVPCSALQIKLDTVVAIFVYDIAAMI